MTFNREHMPYEEWRETFDIYIEEYQKGLIDEAEFRSRLVKLGLNPAEIEHEVSVHRPRELF